MKRILVISVVITTFFIGCVILLAWQGQRNRSFAGKIVAIGRGTPNINILTEQKQAYGLWKELGLRSRVILHFSEILDVNTEHLAEHSYSIRTHDTEKIDMLTRQNDSILANDNYMLFAMAMGIARKIIGVMPKENLSEIDKELNDAGYYHYEGYYRARFQGIPKIITDLKKIAGTDEPVLINFDEDFFKDPHITPAEVYETMTKANLLTDLITVSLPRGESESNIMARDKTLSFIAMLKTPNDRTKN